MKLVKSVVGAVCVVALLAGPASAKSSGDAKWDQDGNGIADVGIVVGGNYTSVYAYDNDGEWYWDLGDGRVQGTVGSIDELNADTLTQCDYVINYRGEFNNDPFQDTGWIQNHIRCHGFDDNNTYSYTIVHESDPRYTGNPEWSLWGTWEYKTLTISGEGNLVRPYLSSGV